MPEMLCTGSVGVVEVRPFRSAYSTVAVMFRPNPTPAATAAPIARPWPTLALEREVAYTGISAQVTQGGSGQVAVTVASSPAAIPICSAASAMAPTVCTSSQVAMAMPTAFMTSPLVASSELPSAKSSTSF